MKHLQSILDSMARLMYKPYNVATAAMDHFDAIRTHGDDAMKEWDEVCDMIRDYEALEAENAEMRKLLRIHGITYKGKEEAA